MVPRGVGAKDALTRAADSCAAAGVRAATLGLPALQEARGTIRWVSSVASSFGLQNKTAGFRSCVVLRIGGSERISFFNSVLRDRLDFTYPNGASVQTVSLGSGSGGTREPQGSVAACCGWPALRGQGAGSSDVTETPTQFSRLMHLLPLSRGRGVGFSARCDLFQCLRSVPRTSGGQCVPAA